MSDFEVAFDREIRRKLERPAELLVSDIAEEIFFSIQGKSVGEATSEGQNHHWSGYFHANQSITLGNLSDFTLYPSSRPWTNEPGAIQGLFESGIASNTAQQLLKLESVEYGQTVYVGTAVPYARDVGWTPGQGEQVYREAAAEGAVKGYAKWKARRF